MNPTLEDQIATYAAHLDGLSEPVSEFEIGSRTRSATPRVRSGLIAVAAAAVVIVVVGAVSILTQFGGHEQGSLTTPLLTSAQTMETTPTTPPGHVSSTTVLASADVFSWSEDDLSEWVTEGDMTLALEDVLNEEFDGGAVFERTDDEFNWSFGGWQVTAHNGDHRPEGGVVEPTMTDPRLPQGVTYETLSGFAHGFYGLSGPNSDESICMTVFPPGTSYGYPQGTEVESHEDRVFALASLMLQEMGWIEPEDVVSAPVAVFDLQTDSLCDWFTADDMNEIIAAAQRRASTDYTFEAFRFPAGSCDWQTPGFFATGSDDSVFVHLAETDDEVDPDEFLGHRLLDDAVSYQIRTYQFSWQEGVDGYLRVDGYEDQILYFGFGVDDHDRATYMTGEYEELGLAVFNELLQRMGWIDSGT